MVAAVTGAFGDIGKAICRKLAEDGYDIALIWHSQSAELHDIFGENTARHAAFQCDISDEAQVKSTAEQILQKFGRIDLIVNNAGISKSGLVTDFDGKDFDEIFGVNMKGAFLLCNAFLPQMIHQKSGSIINISSIWGECGASCEVLYSASKAALIGYTKALAMEAAPSNIRVNAITPGFIDTKMNDDYSAEDKADFAANTPLERLGNVNDVANAVSFLASDKASFITGQVLGVNGGYYM